MNEIICIYPENLTKPFQMDTLMLCWKLLKRPEIKYSDLTSLFVYFHLISHSSPSFLFASPCFSVVSSLSNLKNKFGEFRPANLIASLNSWEIIYVLNTAEEKNGWKNSKTFRCLRDNDQAKCQQILLKFSTKDKKEHFFCQRPKLL